jgi:nucleoside-diphosphate-sugar epimerase
MISILGCGWYGLALGKALVQQGLKVNGSTTSADRMDELATARVEPYLVNVTADIAEYNAGFFNCETLVISIPPKLRSGETDYVAKIQRIISLIIKHNINQVIYISSTGVYPESNATFDELTIPEPNTDSGKTLFEAEELFRGSTAFKTSIIRFGGLVGPGRHPGRFFAGKTHIPNGQAPVNLVHLQDCLGITLSILQQRVYGEIINACSPHHPTKSEFYTQAALHAGLPLPQFKDELLSWKIINSIKVPNLLHYHFKVDNWLESFTGNNY